MRSPLSPRLGVIGCGAITESFYLPALKTMATSTSEIIFIDSSHERAERTRSLLGSGRTSQDYGDYLDQMDCAIVAVPHHLHHRIASNLLRRGIHVLCEKPLAVSSSEVEELDQLARQHKAVLAVNNTRRTYPSTNLIHQLLQDHQIGQLERIEILDGSEFNWPTASGFYFDHRLTTHGVLLDMGAHVLDLICWWLGSKPQLVRAETDSYGGPEAVVALELRHEDCRCSVRLSRLAKLPNTIILKGTRGTIECQAYDPYHVNITRNGRSRTIKARSRQFDAAGTILGNFFEAVNGRTSPLVSSAAVLPSIRLIEEAYMQAQRFTMRWYDAEGAAA